MDALVNQLSDSKYFIVMSGVFSIVGTIISIFVLMTSTKIKKAVLKSNQTIEFKKAKNKLIVNFTAFRDNFLVDNLAIDEKAKSDIRVELFALKNNFSTLLSLYDRFYIMRVLKIIKKSNDKINITKLCLSLDHIIVKFKTKEVSK